jgi:hypothetical protein
MRENTHLAMRSRQTLIQAPLQIAQFQNHEQPSRHGPEQFKDRHDQALPFDHGVSEPLNLLVVHLGRVEERRYALVFGLRGRRRGDRVRVGHSHSACYGGFKNRVLRCQLVLALWAGETSSMTRLNDLERPTDETGGSV